MEAGSPRPPLVEDVRGDPSVPTEEEVGGGIEAAEETLHVIQTLVLEVEEDWG